MKTQNIILLLAIFLAANTWAIAQYNPKGKVPRAEAMLNQGKLDNAKAEIDLAFEVNHKGKVAEDGKAWYNKGRIYKAIYTDEGEYNKLAPNALDIAIEAFHNVRKFERENSIWVVYTDQEMQQLYSVVINNGAEAYGDDDYALAYEEFFNALKVMPGDTIALLYGGTAAQMADMWDEALGMYEKLAETDYTEMLDVYKTLIYVYRAQKEDNDKALATIMKALERYPDDDALQQERVSVLITMQKTDEARLALTESIKENPNDPVLYYQLGYLFYYEERPDEAYENFSKAVQLKPDYYEANFYAGIQWFNKAAEILKDLNNMSMKEYNEKVDEYAERSQENFKKSLPYLEKAYEIKNDDISLMESLLAVYTRLRMNDKAKAMEEKVRAIRGADYDE
ncbi:MAG: hypothetical protein JJU28_23450 [Cyclobacteriaceae bacterium]|nr:hypothetical protein [Cyclobacteriaceae bacterium]